MSFKLCVVKFLVKSYTFVMVFVTLANFQGHWCDKTNEAY